MVLNILCIGTPKVIGDSVGPRVGTLLEELKLPSINIIGTMKDPVHRLNYVDKLKLINHDVPTICVDAAVGSTGIKIVNGPMVPGAAVMSGGPSIGDVSIYCYVGTTLEDILHCCEATAQSLAIEAVEAITTLLAD